MADNPLYPDSTDSFDTRWSGLPVDAPRFNYTPNSSLIESEPRKAEPFKLVPVQGDPFERSAERSRAPYKHVNDIPEGKIPYRSNLPLIAQKFINTAVSGATAARDAKSGAMQMTDPETGMPTDEAIRRSIDMAALGGPGMGASAGKELEGVRLFGKRLMSDTADTGRAVAAIEPRLKGEFEPFKFTPVESTAVSDAFKNRFNQEYLPNGVPKPEAFDRVLPAVRNTETGKISTTKRGDEHASILDKLWAKQGGDPGVSTFELYNQMLPKHEMGFYDPKEKKFWPREHPDWQNIDSPDLTPRQAMKSGQVFSDTSKPGLTLALVNHIKDSAIQDQLYHGTKSASKIKETGELKPSVSGEFGPGVYLARDPGTADFFASNVAKGDEGPSILPVYANIKNPFTVTKQDWIKMTENKTPKQVQDKLKKQGYDGIVGIGINGSTKQIVAFEPSQVKSAFLKEDTSKPAQVLSSLTAAQRKAYNKEAFHNGGQLLVPDASADTIQALSSTQAYKKWDKAAHDAGFTTDAYHGTNAFEGSAIEPKRAGQHEFYSSDEPKLAQDYGNQILPLKLNTSNYHVIDAHGKHWDQINEAAIKSAKAEGKNGVTIKNLRDSSNDTGFVEPATVHITFDPSTVRSRFAKFNPEDIKKNGLLLSDTQKPGMAMAALRDAPTFYSAVEHAVNNIKQQKMPADQWLGTLSNAKGVKPEEMDWLGLKEHLASKGKEPITKQEVHDLVNQNKVELKEVNKGYSHEAELKGRQLAESQGHNWDDVSPVDRRRYIQTANGARLTEDIGGTKYSQYQLPGGENYREKLLTLPENKSQAVENFNKFKQQLEIKHNTHIDSAHDAEKITGDKSIGDKYQDLLYEAQKDQSEKGINYRSSHWDEPNVLAHVRMNDRNIEGKKSLHIEEIQSDWHQAGRDKGYKDTDLKPLFDKQEQLRKERIALTESIYEKITGYKTRREALDFSDLPTIRRADEAVANNPDFIRLGQEHREAERKLEDAKSAVPNAPFKKTWHELVLKRMIREAAEKGYDRISWTPGEAQATRYDLSKQVSKVYYNPEKQNLVVYGKNNESLIDKNVPKDKLGDYIGKEAAEKLVNTPVQGKNHVLEGDGLKVGGEGMKGFYDKMIPVALERIGKEHGVKVKQANININKPNELMEKLKEHDYNEDIDVQTILADNGGRMPGWLTNEDLKAIENGEHMDFKGRQKQPVHYIDIPESLKNVAMKKGFPLFSGGHVFTPIAGNPFNDNQNNK